MVDKRIDIEVVDKGSDKAAKGLRAIAVEAERADKAIRDLQSAMGGTSAARVQELATASSRASTELREMAATQTRVSTAMSTTATSTKAATSATQAHTAAVKQAATATKLAGHHQANLVAQLNDIGVSLAGGMNPFLVLIQQGSQLQDLSMRVDGGFKTLTMSVARMVAPFTAAAAVFGVMAVQFKDFQDSINDTSGLDEYVKTLGLTKDEIKELENVHVTMGDVVMGAWDTVKEALNLGPALEAIRNAFTSTVDFIWNLLKGLAFGIQATLVTTYRVVVNHWQQFPAMFADIFMRAVNGAIGALEWLANNNVKIFNALGFNFDEVSFKRFANAHAGAANVIGETYTQAFKEAESNYNAFADRTMQNAQRRARGRLAGQAGEIIDDRSEGRSGGRGRTDRTEENRAHALKLVNEQLDNELSRMRMLKPEREIQQKMDQIEEQLLRKKITLNEQERASILAKVTAIRSENDIMAESDRIMEDLTKAQRTHDATIEASKRLYDAGKISAENYYNIMRQAGDALDEANDPLHKYQKTLDENNRTMGLYGDALEKANFQEQMRLALLAHSGPLDEAGLALLRERVRLMGQEFAITQQKRTAADIVQQVAGPALEDQNMLANKDLVYEALEARRQVDLQNETAYLQAKLALNRKFSDLENKNTLDTFDELAKLSSSGYAELAAIGKAAAIARATYNMYLAASEALTLPFPANIPAIAKTLVMGTQIISQLKSGGSSHAGGFYTGGQIMVGGRSGRDANNINMDVTRGERVTIETPAQQRATDNAIAAGQGGGGGQAAAPVIQNVVVIDPQQMVSAINTDAGATQILNVIQARPQEFNAVLGRT